jgi:subtilisin family serine protease
MLHLQMACRLIAGVFVLCLLVLGAPSEDLAAQHAGRVRVIVGLRAAHQPEARLSGPAAVLEQRARVRQTMDAVVSNVPAGSLGRVRALETLPFFTAEVDAAGLAELRRSPFVASVEQDAARPPALAQSVPLVEGVDAWEGGFSGAGWTVAVLDTGVDAAHPFMGGKVVGEACFSTTDQSGWTSSQSLCPSALETAEGFGSGAPCDSGVPNCDHGTHVAGIAAGAGGAFSGVARDASVLAIQVFSKFSGADCGGAAECLLAWDSDVLAALDRVYALRDAFALAAVNLSLGGALLAPPCDASSPSMKAAIDQLRAAGIATVAAAGNGQSTTALTFPACISTAVSVGATTKTDAVSGFSNTSASMSLLAPGESIDSSVPGGGFAFKSGTSMAAPHVAGTWAVLKQRKPDASVDELLEALRRTGLGVTDSRAGSGLTFPRIRVAAALAELRVPQPYMALDAPVSPASVGPSFAVAGWAVDMGAMSGTGVDAVHVWAFPSDGRSPIFIGEAAYGSGRSDVARVLGSSQFTNSGFTLTASGLAPGDYQVVAYARSTVAGTFNNARVASIAVTASQSDPLMVVDTPQQDAVLAASFRIAGWALDRGATSGSGVDAIHVWALPTGGGDPFFVGAAGYGGARPDVGDVFGRQFDLSGYVLEVRTVPPGAYDLVVYARSSVAGAFNQARVVRVTILE